MDALFPSSGTWLGHYAPFAGWFALFVSSLVVAMAIFLTIQLVFQRTPGCGSTSSLRGRLQGIWLLCAISVFMMIFFVALFIRISFLVLIVLGLLITLVQFFWGRALSKLLQSIYRRFSPTGPSDGPKI